VTRIHYGTLAVVLLAGVVIGAALGRLSSAGASRGRARAVSPVAGAARPGDSERGRKLLASTDWSYFLQKCSGDVSEQKTEAYRSWTEHGFDSLTEAMNLQGLLIVAKLTDKRDLFASLHPFADPYKCALVVYRRQAQARPQEVPPREVLNCIFSAAPYPGLAPEIGLAWAGPAYDAKLFKLGSPDEALAALVVLSESGGDLGDLGHRADQLQSLISLCTFRGLENMSLMDAVHAANRAPNFIRYPDKKFAEWDDDEAMLEASMCLSRLRSRLERWQNVRDRIAEARRSTGTPESPLSRLLASLETDPRRRAELDARRARALQGAADIAAAVAAHEKRNK